MTGDSADRVGRTYRAAGETLDERPSATARAAILAAAARQIHAAPRDASVPIAVPVRRMPRWPMAAAAAVLLSTLAVMMAVRTEHEMPTFTPPVESETQREQAPAAAPASPSAATAPASDRVAGGAAPPVGRAPSLARDSAVSAAAPISRPAGGADAPRRDAAQFGESKVAAPVAEPRAKEEAAAITAPASAPPAAPPVAAKRSVPAPSAASADAASAEASAPAPAVESRRNEAPSLSRAPARQAPAVGGALAAAEKPRTEMDAPVNELRAEDWLERIIKLRQAGRHDEADAELKRFRERHPQVQIPAAALPPSGTR